MPKNVDDCVSWAAGDVTAALKSAGIDPAAASVNVVYPCSSLGEQSFSITLSHAVIIIQAGDSVGAMYGLQELAEQINNAADTSTWDQMISSLHETTQHPYLEIRAENAFIHLHPLLLKDLDMWRSYIDMLARNRFNMLDLHGSYDLKTTWFPNLYPALIHVPDYPDVGDPMEQARNLADFRTIIAYAKSRGIKVAFMNYTASVEDVRDDPANDALPPFKTVPPGKLADYTAKAVTGLIDDLPDLYMLGFRVGESGQDAAFYHDAYIKGILNADRPDLLLYTRSWKTTKEQLEPIAQVAHNGFDIEIKYNGEQLGLPYQALQGSYGTYSYQAYLDIPADYRIIWQVRANGTHRFWSWEDTQFIRRTVQSLTMGHARGFTLEPLTAYFSVDPAAYYSNQEDRDVFKYMWEKYWMWYFAWGRLSYNPELPDDTLERVYEQHFGPAGKTIYSAVQKAGVVVPLVCAYRFMGPDQRDFSPETEIGVQLDKTKDEPSALLKFIGNRPEDQRSFAGIGQFVDAKLAGKPDGRLGPIAVATGLSQAAKSTRDLAASVPALSGSSAGQWRLLKTDILCASWLGDYYANEIEGLTYFDYALKTGRDQEFQASLQYFAQARQAWKQLAAVADGTYEVLNNPLRHQTNFHWSDQLAAIDRLNAAASDLWVKRSPKVDAGPLTFTTTDLDEDAGLRVENLKHTVSNAMNSATISCDATAGNGVARVILWFKPLPSESKWQSTDMTRLSDGSYSTTMPLTNEGLMYLVEVQDKTGHAGNFPQVMSETPYRVIPPFVDEGKDTVSNHKAKNI